MVMVKGQPWSQENLKLIQRYLKLKLSRQTVPTVPNFPNFNLANSQNRPAAKASCSELSLWTISMPSVRTSENLQETHGLHFVHQEIEDPVDWPHFGCVDIASFRMFQIPQLWANHGQTQDSKTCTQLCPHATCLFLRWYRDTRHTRYHLKLSIPRYAHWVPLKLLTQTSESFRSSGIINYHHSTWDLSDLSLVIAVWHPHIRGINPHDIHWYPKYIPLTIHNYATMFEYINIY